jgi:hypothetical protein
LGAIVTWLQFDQEVPDMATTIMISRLQNPKAITAAGDEIYESNQNELESNQRREPWALPLPLFSGCRHD